MPKLRAILLCALPGVVACAQQSGRALRVDSLVLNRTACFGVCPVYQLSISADGRVTFIQGDSVITSSIKRSEFAWLVRAAESIDFYKFPPDIMRDRSLCPMAATDMPGISVTIFRPDSTFRVKDYLGCFVGPSASVSKPLAELHHFERQIDSVARSESWIRPRRG
jgi:hypothetical protein